MCPLGGGRSISCPAQAGTIIGVLALLCVVPCVCLMRGVRRKLRPKDNGQWYDACKPEGDDLFESPNAPLKENRNPGSRRAPEPEQERPDSRAAIDISIDDGVLDMETSMAERGASRNVPPTTVIGQSSYFSAYAEGEIVEFFSKSHWRWIEGETRVQACGGAGGAPLIDVYVDGKHFHSNVALDCLRPILRPGELVEVSSDGKSIPAVLASIQPPAATQVGYHVRVENKGEILANIPAIKLRRRFRARASVEVYRGPTVGWCQARVHGAMASADGCSLEVLPMPQVDSAAQEGPRSAQMPRSRAADRGLRSSAAAEDPELAQRMGLTAGIWTRIPILTADGKSERVPSYLVRASRYNQSDARGESLMDIMPDTDEVTRPEVRSLQIVVHESPEQSEATSAHGSEVAADRAELSRSMLPSRNAHPGLMVKPPGGAPADRPDREALSSRHWSHSPGMSDEDFFRSLDARENAAGSQMAAGLLPSRNVNPGLMARPLAIGDGQRSDSTAKTCLQDSPLLEDDPGLMANPLGAAAAGRSDGKEDALLVDMPPLVTPRLDDDFFKPPLETPRLDDDFFKSLDARVSL